MKHKNCIKCASSDLDYISAEFHGWIECNSCGYEGPKANYWDRSNDGDNSTLWNEAWELWDEEHFIKEWEEKNGKTILK